MMSTQYVYALVGLTAIVAMLVGALTFAALRIFAAARDTRSHLREGGAETALLSAALQEAVTKLRAQEQAMSARAEASERLSEEIVASLTAGLLVVSDGGQVRILNPAGRRLLGLGDVPLSHYRTLLAGAPPLAEAIEECVTTRQPIVRRALRMPEGTGVTHFGVTVSPLGGHSEHHGAICLFSDLTAVMELEDQLRLKEALARLGELTAGIAPEVRNGLATIHGYSRLMDLQAMPEVYRPYVTGIRDEAEALGRIVTNFLNFAKPDQVSFAPVDLGSLAARVVDELRHESAGQIAVRGSFGTIQGDDVLLRQALFNLIRNAVDACQQAGVSPSVTVEGHVDGPERLCRVTVHDNGPGVDPGVRERVFRPFFTTKPQGTGLGLAIVQKVVVTHNGRVIVGTSPLGGASFQLTFPLAPGDPSSVTKSNNSANPSGLSR